LFTRNPFKDRSRPYSFPADVGCKGQARYERGDREVDGGDGNQVGRGLGLGGPNGAHRRDLVAMARQCGGDLLDQCVARGEREVEQRNHRSTTDENTVGLAQQSLGQG
jgi:hypothetical protein